MDAPTGAALTGQQSGEHRGSRDTVVPARVAATPVRIAAPAPAAMPAARPMPMPQAMPRSDADLRTRPLPLTQPVLAARPVPAGPVMRATPPKQTWSRQLREYVRQLNPLQVLCWQVAVLTVVLTLRQPWPVLVGAAVGAAVLLALTSVRIGGRWGYELTVLGAAFLTRARRRDLPKNGGVPAMTLALLELLLPGAAVRTLETSQGNAMAISHRGGLTAQLRPRELTPEVLAVLPMPAALLPTVTDSAGQHHVFGVQLVLHAGVRVDTPRRLWLAVHAARTVDTPADAELTLALRNAVRRVRRALDRAGVAAHPLAEEQALAAIAGLTHVTGGRNEVREGWRVWRTGTVSQAAFRLTGWDRLTDTQARGLLSGLLAGIPGAALTMTLGAKTERRGDPRGFATLRLAATSEAALGAAADAIANRLVPMGVRPARLDGAHLSGVAASLPIGVFS